MLVPQGCLLAWSRLLSPGCTSPKTSRTTALRESKFYLSCRNRKLWIIMHFKVGSGDFVHSEGRLVFHTLPGQEVGRKKERAISCVFSSLFLSGVSGLPHCLLTGLPPTNPWRSCLTITSFQICPRRISGSVLCALTVVYISFTLACLLPHFSHHEFLESRDHTH